MVTHIHTPLPSLTHYGSTCSCFTTLGIKEGFTNPPSSIFSSSCLLAVCLTVSRSTPPPPPSFLPTSTPLLGGLEMATLMSLRPSWCVSSFITAAFADDFVCVCVCAQDQLKNHSIVIITALSSCTLSRHHNYLTAVLNVGEPLGPSSPVSYKTNLLHLPTLWRTVKTKQ